MKLLCISYCLPPYLYPQSIQIGRLLSHLENLNQHDITIITAEEQNGPLDPTFQYAFKNKIQIKSYYNKYINYIKNRFLGVVYQQPDVYLGWHQKVLTYVKKHYSPKAFDAILTFSYPLSANILGKALSAYLQIPWIAHNS